jgi:four helix bundle protein
MDLVELIYKITKAFPKEEVYALTNQLRRASVSIPSNIAEGHSRKATRSYIHFLNVAYGSLKEVETQILIALRLKYLPEEESKTTIDLTTEIGRLISGLRKSLVKKDSEQH